eukprot:GDKI01042734.1.p1 GENE.GDKI01042734.1~~GDKI01042734.1.p1  ORF type:complete len:429 (-),score=54.08 GDKI01042734.1:1238-2524(-)
MSGETVGADFCFRLWRKFQNQPATCVAVLRQVLAKLTGVQHLTVCVEPKWSREFVNAIRVYIRSQASKLLTLRLLRLPLDGEAWDETDFSKLERLAADTGSLGILESCKFPGATVFQTCRATIQQDDAKAFPKDCSKTPSRGHRYCHMHMRQERAEDHIMEYSRKGDAHGLYLARAIYGNLTSDGERGLQYIAKNAPLPTHSIPQSSSNYEFYTYHSSYLDTLRLILQFKRIEDDQTARAKYLAKQIIQREVKFLYLMDGVGGFFLTVMKCILEEAEAIHGKTQDEAKDLLDSLTFYLVDVNETLVAWHSRVYLTQGTTIKHVCQDITNPLLTQVCKSDHHRSLVYLNFCGASQAWKKVHNLLCTSVYDCFMISFSTARAAKDKDRSLAKICHDHFYIAKKVVKLRKDFSTFWVEKCAIECVHLLFQE